MPRIHSEPSPTALVLAGTLRTAIVAHTKERMRHFFLFLYLYRMLMHVLQCPSGKWQSLVSIKATHQIDIGMRRDEAWETAFKNDDVSVLDLAASAFKRVDATHFCNLGLKPALAGLCAESTDARARAIYDALVLVCGNTRLMPQRINIGPDRVVDRVHGDLCMAFLKQMASGAAPVCPALFRTYRADVVSNLQRYAQGQNDNGNVAVAEAAGIYIATIEETDPPQELRSQGKASRWVNTRSAHSDEVWATLLGNVEGDFFSYGFNRDDTCTVATFVTRKVL